MSHPPDQPSWQPRPTIVCALRHEMAALHSAGLHRRFNLACCGPGATGVQRWAAANRRLPSGSIVILAGLAAGLREQVRAGSAWIVREVIDPESGLRRHPSLRFSASETNARTLSMTSISHALTTPGSKRDCRQRTGADLADMESVEFARVCETAGWSWAVVKGVSDDLEMPLPQECMGWLNEGGGVRIGRVLRGLLARPSLAGELSRLRKWSRAAMANVAAILHQAEF